VSSATIAVRAATATLLSAALALPIGTGAHAEELNRTLNETVLTVPKEGIVFSVELETTIFKPAGAGPFPVVVINHGKFLGDVRHQGRYRPLMAARYFLQRGYVVVVPMRQGFSKSTGNYIDAGCNIESNGLEQAEDVRVVLDHVTAQPYADRNNIIVLGQSHGGWTTLAFGTFNYPGVRGLVNFAGGLRQDSCGPWTANLVNAAESYGAETAVPSLWFYGDNDSYFGPTTFRLMHQAYTSSGGRAKLVAFGKFGRDAHLMFSSLAGRGIWQPEVSAFLQQLGLPYEVTRPQYANPSSVAVPPRTDFAPLYTLESVPHVREKGRAGYAAFLAKDFPRAFALAPNGAWASASGDTDPHKRALDSCNKDGQGACKLYAVDDVVVWAN
jgi:dienelactone hydrolase